jgi:outer membrane immunogenic protein
MKNILLAGVALVALGSAASAADLAARPYTKAPAMVSPVFNWSGFYAGVMGGYGWATDGNGGFGGGTLGYNWQAPGSQFVFGIEADAAGSDLKATQNGVVVVPGVGAVPFGANSKIEAFGSVTGRIGVALDATLLYAKGGFAWGENKASATVGALSSSNSQTHTGYTVGGGVEYMFAPNWSAKAEYMYTNLSSETYTLFGTSFASGNLDFNTVKVGVNYHFH